MDWATDAPRELVAEEEISEPVNDAVYKRNMIIKQKYNIDIKMVSESDEVSLLHKSVIAGDDIYDAVVILNHYVPRAVTSNLLTEISTLPYINLEKPWWDPGVNSMSIANKQYLLAGDFLILDNEATNAIIFNKDLMAKLGINLPYNLVKEGKWTMDVLYKMSKDAEMNLDGTGKFNPDIDRFGFMTFNDTLQALLVAGGGTLASKDKDDIPYISFIDSKNLNVLEKSMDLIYKKSNSGAFNIQSLPTHEDWLRVYFNSFMEDRALFMWIRMRVVEAFRGMDSDFGILPMPKYDEAQTNYYSLVNSFTGVLMGVPKIAEDLERTSVILEALSAESKYTLQPAYYDIVLQRKFARDEESSEMLDIIFTTRIYDIGGVYDFGGVFSEFISLASNQSRNVSSLYERKILVMEKDIEKVVEQFENLD